MGSCKYMLVCIYVQGLIFRFTTKGTMSIHKELKENSLLINSTFRIAAYYTVLRGLDFQFL